MPTGSHNDPKFADEPEGLGAAVTDNGEDTEGHLRSFITDDGSTDGPEGMKTRVTDEGDDTEGHMHAMVTDDGSTDEDTEGHKLRPNVTDDGTIPNGPEGWRISGLTEDADGDAEPYARM